jgi:hypothetical protein
MLIGILNAMAEPKLRSHRKLKVSPFRAPPALRGPSVADLRRKAKEAEGLEGPDIGPMSHAERAKLLFGL